MMGEGEGEVREEGGEEKWAKGREEGKWGEGRRREIDEKEDKLYARRDKIEVRRGRDGQEKF